MHKSGAPDGCMDLQGLQKTTISGAKSSVEYADIFISVSILATDGTEQFQCRPWLIFRRKTI